jgi:hypothetical protein
MIHDYVLFGLGAAMVSIGLAYICWTHLRVIMLRQRLFEIRDALWDDATALNGLADPAYRATREHLNGAIRIVRWLSLPVIARANPSPGFVVPKSEDPLLQEAIDRAYADCADAIVHYLMRQTVCGLFVSAVASCYSVWKGVSSPMSRFAAWFKKRFGSPVERNNVAVWMGSEEFRLLDLLEDAHERPRHGSLRRAYQAV